MTATLSGWQAVNDGPVWVPVLNQTEDALGIPTNLLARVAYQESRFRPEVIDGTYPNPKSGALGIMQMMPQWFKTVQRPIPFSTVDVADQITEAGGELVRLYHVFGDWGTALAAYNDGERNIQHYLAGTRGLPQETKDYVTQVLADVGLPTNFAVA